MSNNYDPNNPPPPSPPDAAGVPPINQSDPLSPYGQSGSNYYNQSGSNYYNSQPAAAQNDPNYDPMQALFKPVAAPDQSSYYSSGASPYGSSSYYGAASPYTNPAAPAPTTPDPTTPAASPYYNQPATSTGSYYNTPATPPSAPAPAPPIAVVTNTPFNSAAAAPPAPTTDTSSYFSQPSATSNYSPPVVETPLASTPPAPFVPEPPKATGGGVTYIRATSNLTKAHATGQLKADDAATKMVTNVPRPGDNPTKLVSSVSRDEANNPTKLLSNIPRAESPQTGNAPTKLLSTIPNNIGNAPTKLLSGQSAPAYEQPAYQTPSYDMLQQNYAYDPLQPAQAMPATTTAQPTAARSGISPLILVIAGLVILAVLGGVGFIILGNGPTQVDAPDYPKATQGKLTTKGSEYLNTIYGGKANASNSKVLVTPDNQADVNKFYREKLVKDGWVARGEGDLKGQLASTFVKGKKLLYVLIGDSSKGLVDKLDNKTYILLLAADTA